VQANTYDAAMRLGVTPPVEVAGFPAAGQPVPPGQDVTATVICAVDMSPLTVLGFHPAMVFTGQAVAPLDVFTCRAPAC